jgi:hypothetical protein
MKSGRLCGVDAKNHLPARLSFNIFAIGYTSDALAESFQLRMSQPQTVGVS